MTTNERSPATENDPRTEFGTLFPLMPPFAVFFLLSWIAFLIAWTLLGLPICPGVDVNL